MFDLRIIVAVFLTLWGVAIGLANGVLDLQGISSFDTGNLDVGIPFLKQDAVIPIQAEFKSEKIPTFNKIFSKPVPKLQLTYYSSSGSLYLRNSEVTFSEETAIIELSNFKGSIKFGEVMVIDGKAEKITINNVTFKDADIKTGPINPIELKMLSSPLSNYDFDKASGTVVSAGTTVNIEGKPISMKSFEGDSDFIFTNGTYIFKGKISKLQSAGSPILTLNK